jgi:ankyrin repeat protein
MGKSEMGKYLHDRGFLCNLRDNLGRTPLHWEVHQDNISFLYFLIDVDPYMIDDCDKEGRTVLHYSRKTL